ncbi:MAG: TA system VapC family ribonuclease toxin [Gammaproteobacteria bacterium]
MRALLDVNVLIALLDGAHIHHAIAKQWLQAEIESGWASCPITQNGCLRIMSQSAYPGAQAPAEIAQRLRHASETPWHAFWPDDLSLLARDTLDWNHVLGSRQLTDLYLLALAVHQDGRLVTLDRGIPLHAVPGATPDHLVRILEPS